LQNSTADDVIGGAHTTNCPANCSMAVWRMNRRVDLPWQSTHKRSLETVMFHNITGLLEMAVCCAKPPYRALPEETQAVWDRLFKPQWGEFPSSPPETISKTISPECSALSDRYNVTCRKPGTGRCKGETDPDKKAEYIANSIECVNQRVEYMKICADGGDSRHWDQVRDRVEGIGNCCLFE
jgi:hypothetical protein